MWRQRIHGIYAERVRRGESVTLESLDVPENRSWYPFQLAFILLNLPALTDLHHPERRDEQQAVADLLWFPTGGGKTEAYLGTGGRRLGYRDTRDGLTVGLLRRPGPRHSGGGERGARRFVSASRARYRVGELRPSRLLLTFGIGSVVDLPSCPSW